VSARTAKRIHFVSLGCPKNRVDTEVMLGVLRAEGHELVASPEQAEVVVVNTCAFIGEAKQESVDAILEMAAHKQRGVERLVVTGCLSQRYPGELAADLPEVDAFLGSSDMMQIGEAVAGRSPRLQVAAEPRWLYDDVTPRAASLPGFTAYVKIAEGCDRPCAFCIIPKLRGAQRSRAPESVEREVRDLVARGCREVNLVAQDLTNYGRDLPAPATLAQLVRRLARVEGLRWLRLHYLYPSAVTDELVAVVAEEPTVVKYFDMPIQHIDDGVLKTMRRGHTARTIREALAKLRERVPGAVMRTTVIVGHPGESEEQFQRLCEFVRDFGFDRLGAFGYSHEEGTVSALLPRRVPAREIEWRRRELMRIQREVSKRKQRELVGRELEVLVEGVSDESEYLLQGRWWGQAPEIDGTVYLADGTAAPGEFVRARVTHTADYDLAATLAISQG
jgi:ribosomal protein S12 methylthiotransferase